MKVNILGTDYKIHFVDEFPEYLKEVGEGADGLWLNDPLKMVYCSIIFLLLPAPPGALPSFVRFSRSFGSGPAKSVNSYVLRIGFRHSADSNKKRIYQSLSFL